LARAKAERNGRLEEAMTNLLQSQTMLVQNQAAFLPRASKMDQLLRQIELRLGRIEALLMEHSRILAEILETLPDRIGAKLGFQVSTRERPAE
jgi:hypothetical protein